MNQVCLIGRLVDFPKTTANEKVSVVRFTLAVRKEYKPSENSPDAEFINCVAFNKVGEVINKFTEKGTMLGLVGQLQTRSYEKDGIKRYVTEVVASKIDLINNKNEPKKTEEYATKTLSVFDNLNSVDMQDDDLPF